MKKDNDQDQIKKIEELEKQVSDLNEKYLRALADYHNLQRQTDSWREEFTQYANKNLAGRLLEVLDDLEKASDHINDEGLKLVIGKLQNILKEEGLEEIEVMGKEYNPETAEVVSTEPGEKDHVVVKVLQKGYRLKDRVLRAAKVIVSIINS